MDDYLAEGLLRLCVHLVKVTLQLVDIVVSHLSFVSVMHKMTPKSLNV